ncbi:hypothetical protein GCM10009836_14290 [Pseudonocardia ailaonensis]|uniref:Uncharacterized protein n=1 Tax=Pseudonocardia ailaonensis TaxID=367279 RepID=A0ABN2MTH9_9PSEU
MGPSPGRYALSPFPSTLPSTPPSTLPPRPRTPGLHRSTVSGRPVLSLTEGLAFPAPVDGVTTVAGQ